MGCVEISLGDTVGVATPGKGVLPSSYLLFWDAPCDIISDHYGVFTKDTCQNSQFFVIVLMKLDIMIVRSC